MTNTIIKIEHYGLPFFSNENARLIYYGQTYCWVYLLD